MTNTNDTPVQITHEFVTEEDLRLRRDSAWYVSDEFSEHIATVTKADREVLVFRQGEMRVLVWSSKESRNAGEEPEVVRYTGDFVGVGIENDEQLAKAFDEGRVEWEMNSWFDLYANSPTKEEPLNLDCVQHDLPTAIGEAIRAFALEDLWVG